MASSIDADRQEEDRRKRPDVERYKPGAFKKQEPEELIPGFSLRHEQQQRNRGGRRNPDNRRGGGGGGRGHNGHSAENGAPPPSDRGSRTEKKKPEIEHYAPQKKNQRDVAGVDWEDKQKNLDPGGGESGARRRKNRKGKHKDKEKELDNERVKPHNQDKDKPQNQDKDKPHNQDKDKAPNQDKDKASNKGQNKSKPKDSSAGKVPDMKEDKPKISQSDHVKSGSKQEFNSGKNKMASKQNDDIPARQIGKHAQNHKEPKERGHRDKVLTEQRSNGFRVQDNLRNAHSRGDSRASFRGSDRGIKGDRASGRDTDLNWRSQTAAPGLLRSDHNGPTRDTSRRWSQNMEERTRDFGRGSSHRGGRRGGSRGSSPQRSGHGGSRGGGWSRGSSPARSSKGNSPNRHRSKPNSRRSSPQHSRTSSPVRHTRVFHRHSSPPSQRSTVSRTPSPRTRRNRDSRDLEGWTRRDSNRRDEGLWDPEGKPPSGRTKPAPPPARPNLPPRFQKARELEDEQRCRRLESDTSQISDWSVEVDEEEERQSQLGVSPPSGPGVIRVSESGPGLQWGPPPDSQHPAWRAAQANQPPPVHPSWAQTMPVNLDQQKFLFDPSNPMKPIRMQGGSSRDNNLELVGPIPQNLRFPIGAPRFAPPPHMFPPNISPGSGYQPPFPAMRMCRPRPSFTPPMQGPTWYDVYNTNIYGNGKVDINIIVRIVTADKKLRPLLQGGAEVICNRWDLEVRQTRHEIMNAFWQLIKTELLFVCDKDVDTHTWKTVYYQVIETLKFVLQDTEHCSQETRQVIKSHLLTIFEEGVDYYNQLLKDLGEIYHLDLERFFDVLEPRDLNKTGRLALMAAQKVLLCLGDLARYKEQVNSTTNYGKARQFYLKANHLDMRNGRPFNMLAILAKMSNRKFEAVYYNIRCLMSRNPFGPASKEGLNVIFDEMKRRWELGEKQKLDKKLEDEKRDESSCLIKGSRVRREIWIRSEDGRRLHRTTSATTNSESSAHDLDTLSITDLNKRFINTFLHLQGMFFMQINTEDYSLASQSLLQQFRVLISKSPLPISVERLVQIMALNMYSIEKTKMRAGSDSPTYRSVMQTKALELAGDMFSVLLERCNILIAAGDPKDIIEPQSQRQEELTPLLAAVKVWCDWLIGNNDTWYPVVSAEPFTQLAQLATRLELIKPTVTKLLGECLSDETWSALPQSRREEFEIIRLAEDSILCEFEPWFRGLEWSTYRQFNPKTINQLCAQNCKRVDQIRMCAEVLEGLDPPVLKWSVPDNSHVCLVTDRDESTQASVARDMAEANLTALIARDEDILEESYSDKEDDDQIPLELLTDEIAKLRLRKVELEKVQNAQARRAQREILDEHVRTTLEVRPKVLVPDTNEFIDHLDLVKQIAATGEFNVRIPIVVLGELEGLCKSKDFADRPDHGAMLRENSKAALVWIKDKPQNVKCVTTKGSILTSLAMTQEEDTDDGQNNDDRILACCINLDTAPAPVLKDGMKTVHRTSVLLTDDRNLKLKAHIQDCAVSKIGDFIAWVASSPC